MYANFLKKIIR